MIVYVTLETASGPEERTLAVIPKGVNFPGESREAIRRSCRRVADLAFRDAKAAGIRFDDECKECRKEKGQYGCENKACPEGSPPVDVMARLMRKYPGPKDETVGALTERMTALWKGKPAPVIADKPDEQGIRPSDLELTEAPE